MRWLHEWQDLIAGLIGAAALIATVRWTLLAERRRREDEAKALRIALGAELRHFASRALQASQSMVAILNNTERSDRLVSISPLQLGTFAHFPEPVIYPHSAPGLGALGRHAHDIVFFFGQVTLVKDALQHLRESGSPTEVPRLQLVRIAQALFNAADAAVAALPALTDPIRADGDKQFTSEVAKARNSVMGLNSRT